MSAKAERVHLCAATDAAAEVLADRSVFVLDQGSWREFDKALNRPAENVTGLRKLLTMPTVLDGVPRIRQR